MFRGVNFFEHVIEQNISDTQYERCNFTRATIGISTFTDCVFRDCHFTNTFARGVKIENCEFVGCSFEFTYMRGATINNSLFVECSFNNTDMPSQKRSNNTFQECELRHVNLGGAVITNEKMIDPLMLLVHGDGHVYQSMNVGYYPTSWNHEWLQIGCALDTVENWRSNWNHNKEAIYRRSDVAQEWSDKYMNTILRIIDDHYKQD